MSYNRLLATILPLALGTACAQPTGDAPQGAGAVVAAAPGAMAGVEHGPTSAAPEPQPPPFEGCLPTPLVTDSAPPDANADPIRDARWYINDDRTLWAGTVPPNGWRAGDEKTYWVRPRGTHLTVHGRRLDAAAPPLEAHIPCCYPTGFQIVGLSFPAEGCWEVQATAGGRRLAFVTEVRPADGR